MTVTIRQLFADRVQYTRECPHIMWNNLDLMEEETNRYGRSGGWSYGVGLGLVNVNYDTDR